ncbi:MAG: DUF2793 domain-containing protein, partial [Alphaproteobacteria bacterium]|nr:DUF2793 domain-containing protein [Alphaproteobacteria bacterium]
WTGQANYITAYFSGWRSKAPQTGWTVWSVADARLYYYSGTAWATLATPFLQATTTYDPPSLATGATTQSADVAVSGAALGDFVQVAAPYDLQGIVATGFVRAAGQVRIVLHNPTAGAIDLASGTWAVRVQKA